MFRPPALCSAKVRKARYAQKRKNQFRNVGNFCVRIHLSPKKMGKNLSAPTHGQFFPIPSDTKMLPRPPFHINVLPTSNLPPNTAKKFFSNVYKFLRETARKKYGQIVPVVSSKMEEKEVPHQSQRHTTAILAGEGSEFSRIMSLLLSSPPRGKMEEVNKKKPRCPSFDSRR